MNKSELRAVYLEMRRALSASQLTVASRAIAENFFEFVDLTGVRTVHCYIPISKFREVDTSPIFERVWQEYPHITTLVPRVDAATGEMQGFEYRPGTQLVENTWGIREPVDRPWNDTSAIDIVIVPLLCFDERGHRVGYGKGFYDRFLGRDRPDCLKVGLCFFPPIGEIDDVSLHDVTLDRCVTPGRVYLFPPG